jgi:hypothetical protein
MTNVQMLLHVTCKGLVKEEENVKFYTKISFRLEIIHKGCQIPNKPSIIGTNAEDKLMMLTSKQAMDVENVE